MDLTTDEVISELKALRDHYYHFVSGLRYQSWFRKLRPAEQADQENKWEKRLAALRITIHKLEQRQ